MVEVGPNGELDELLDEMFRVGSTTVSPALRPATISVVVSPRRPTTTGRTVCCLPTSTVTLPFVPVPVTADEVTCTTLSTSATITSTSAVMPGLTPAGVGLSKANVTL